jgi:hypothetical protein
MIVTPSGKLEVTLTWVRTMEFNCQILRSSLGCTTTTTTRRIIDIVQSHRKLKSTYYSELLCPRRSNNSKSNIPQPESPGLAARGKFPDTRNLLQGAFPFNTGRIPEVNPVSPLQAMVDTLRARVQMAEQIQEWEEERKEKEGKGKEGEEKEGEEKEGEEKEGKKEKKEGKEEEGKENTAEGKEAKEGETKAEKDSAEGKWDSSEAKDVSEEKNDSKKDSKEDSKKDSKKDTDEKKGNKSASKDKKGKNSVEEFENDRLSDTITLRELVEKLGEGKGGELELGK